ILLLSRIKRHMREELARLPDYTCLETAQRYRTAGGKGGAKPLDTMRIEILYSGKKEMYASPGARSFQDEDVTTVANGGLFGTGASAGNLRALFQADTAMSQYRGEVELDGRRAVRYDYRVPINLSGLVIHLPQASDRVAMKGSFWADPETLNLLRL